MAWLRGRTAWLLALLAACGAPQAATLDLQRVDTDAGRGDALVMVQGRPRGTPVLVEGYRTVRVIEPDGEPDPPSWWAALGLADGARLVVAADGDGAAAARALLMERPERVRGLIWLDEAPVPVELRAAGARQGWPVAVLSPAEPAAIARQVAEWLPASRGTFRVLP